MHPRLRWTFFLPLLLLAWLTLAAGVAQSAAQAPGTWINVTPPNVNLSSGGCGNFGTQSVVVDPARPSDLYAAFNCQGIWKSTDYGQTWTGPINTGSGGASAGDCAGGIAIAPGPILYEACIRGAGDGFQRSLDGGVSWTKYAIGPAGNRQDVYPPVVDPYDAQHLVLTAHELNAIYQSSDGGQTWTNVPMAPGMFEPGGTGFLFFIDTGGAASTRTNWIWLAQGTGGNVGTWRTTDGATWKRVDTNEHAHGSSQIYQPDSGGTVYMAGVYSAEGWGILRSTDYGMTWARVGNSSAENIVFGTPNNVYAGYGWACAQCRIEPNLQIASQPGRAGWTQIPRPAAMGEGFASAATTFDGSNYVILSANWTGGLFRYVEPSGSAPAPTSTMTPTIASPTSTSPPGTPQATSPPIPSTATATPASGTPSSIAGLHVAGNQILNAANQPVKLVGVDRSGTEYMCASGGAIFDGPSDAASIAAVQAWKVNVIRIPLNEDCWLGINGVPPATSGASYQAAITNYIGLLNQAGIAAILDLHWSAPGSILSNKQLAMPDADHAPAFWSSVADAFKSNPSVLFDLFNEPFPDNNGDTIAAWQCLRDGGTCPGVAYPAAGTQALLNAVRATGATNIILVPGLQYTNSLSQWLTYKPVDTLNPPQMAASWHTYADQTCGTQSGCWDPVIKPVMAQVPLIAGEIGERDCQGVYIGPLMNWLDGLGGNYLGWAWDTYDCTGFPSLISSYDGTPTGFGVSFRNHLLGLAGVPTPTPAPVTFFNGGQFPYGINVGSTSSYAATDGTVYLPDQNAADGSMMVKAGAGSGYRMDPYTTTAAIGGPDPALYQKGRSGPSAQWTINVPNDTYVVTLGMAPAAGFTAGEFGQDQTIQGQKVGTCVWSTYSGTNISPLSGGSCPGNVTTAAPPSNQVQTVSYTVQVFNQQLQVQVGASFGSGRSTILNAIRVDRKTAAPPTATATPTVVPTSTIAPTMAPTATVTDTPVATNTPAPTETPTPQPTATLTPQPLVTCRVSIEINGTPGPYRDC